MPLLPTTTQARMVRMLIGDTTSTLVTDQQIGETWDFCAGRLYETAALLCDGLAGRYSSSVTFSVEGLSIHNAEKVANYRNLASTLRQQAQQGDGIGVPVVTGVSRGEMDGVAGDTDRPPSRAAFGRDDFPPGPDNTGGVT